MIELKPNDYDYDDLAYVMFQSTLDLDGIVLVFSCASSVNGSVPYPTTPVALPCLWGHVSPTDNKASILQP